MSELPANWEPPEKPRTEEEQRRRESFRPILITTGVTFTLLLGSLTGVLSTCGSVTQKADPSYGFWSACWTLSLAAFLMSIAWLLVSLIIRLLQRFKNSGSR